MSPVLLHNVILSWWHPQRVSADYPDNFHSGKEVGESNKNDDDDEEEENSRNDRWYLEYIIVLGQTMRDLKDSQVALVVKNLLPMQET